MKGEILGIPLVLIILVFFIALLVDVPLVVTNISTQALLQESISETREVRRLLEITPTPTIVPVETITPTPTKKPVVLKSASTSGQVK